VARARSSFHAGPRKITTPIASRSISNPTSCRAEADTIDTPSAATSSSAVEMATCARMSRRWPRHRRVPAPLAWRPSVPVRSLRVRRSAGTSPETMKATNTPADANMKTRQSTRGSNRSATVAPPMEIPLPITSMSH
jgi:hypothetical protein